MFLISGFNFMVGSGNGLRDELQLHLFQMVTVNMHIAKSMNKLARLQTDNLCHHHSEQCIRGNVERHAQKHIGTALVQLASLIFHRPHKIETGHGKASAPFRQLRHIPGAYNHAAAVRVRFYLIE